MNVWIIIVLAAVIVDCSCDEEMYPIVANPSIDEIKLTVDKYPILPNPIMDDWSVVVEMKLYDSIVE